MPNNQTDTSSEREALLEKLHSISFCAFLTYLPSEGCLEIEVMTKKGTSYCWDSYDSWNVYCLDAPESSAWAYIRDHLSKGSLTKEDLSDTFLSNLDERINEGNSDPSVFYQGLLSLPEELFSQFFCYYDGESVRFFSGMGELSAALNETYPIDTEWETLSTDRLIDLLERYESTELEDRIPCCTFFSEEES